MGGDSSRPMIEPTGEKKMTAQERRELELLECPKPAFTALRPVKGGILTKQGGAFKSWKRRLFLLHGKYLYYYLTIQDKAPRGVLCIDGCTVEEEPDMGKEKKSHCFSITCKKSWNLDNGKSFALRTYYFCTPSFQEMSDWISIIDTMSSTQKEL